jgi:DNA-binding MarR family transcriptional regulator
MGDRGQPALDFGPLTEMVGYQLRRANDVATRRYFAVLADTGITPGQIGVLTLIAKNAGLTQSALSKGLGVDRSTMVAVIDRLEKLDLVTRERSAQDQRAYSLQLTARGTDLMATLLQRLHGLEDELLTKMSIQERDTLVHLLHRLAT